MEAAVVSCPFVMGAVKCRVNNTLFLQVHSRFYILPYFFRPGGSRNYKRQAILCKALLCKNLVYFGRFLYHSETSFIHCPLSV